MRKSQDVNVNTELEECYEIIESLQPSLQYNKKKHKAYFDITCTLDIETTNTQEDGFIYSIAICIAGECMTVRYIEDAISILEHVVTTFGCNEKKHFVIYVHNLGYEHMYMTQVLSEIWKRKNILLTAKRKPLFIEYSNGIEFRDSLKLFQKSLAGATKGCKHAKLKGDLNYLVYRTPETPLTQTEFDYVVNDVLGLYEAIERLKKEHGYNAATIPLTNTGMVVESINSSISHDKKSLKRMEDLRLDKEQLRLAYKCMAGGDTHGCRWRAGRVYENCNSYDFKSAHPSQQLLRLFPSGRPVTVGECEQNDLDVLIEEGFGWIAELYIEGLQIKRNCPDPAISASKCHVLEGCTGYDNGRVLGADAAFVYMDSNDYQRFNDAYDYDDVCAISCVAFRLKYLPDSYTKVIFDYYKIKENAVDGPERNFAKVCVNTVFGASAQKVIRDEYELETDLLDAAALNWEDNLNRKSDEEVLKKQKFRFPFLWGLWTASCTRLELWKMLKIIGWENVIYWDTDSCKFEGPKTAAIDDYNRGIIERCKERGRCCKNRKGETSYIGVAEDEHKTADYGYKRFTFLHAKCYAAETDSGIEATIAGVSKDLGAAALKGDIANLKSGLLIKPAGGQRLYYHDRPVFTRTDFARPTKCASYIYMEDREYLVNDSRSLIFEQEVVIE